MKLNQNRRNENQRVTGLSRGQRVARVLKRLDDGRNRQHGPVERPRLEKDRIVTPPTTLEEKWDGLSTRGKVAAGAVAAAGLVATGALDTIAEHTIDKSLDRQEERIQEYREEYGDLQPGLPENPQDLTIELPPSNK